MYVCVCVYVCVRVCVRRGITALSHSCIQGIGLFPSLNSMNVCERGHKFAADRVAEPVPADEEFAYLCDDTHTHTHTHAHTHTHTHTRTHTTLERTSPTFSSHVVVTKEIVFAHGDRWGLPV